MQTGLARCVWLLLPFFPYVYGRWQAPLLQGIGFSVGLSLLFVLCAWVAVFGGMPRASAKTKQKAFGYLVFAWYLYVLLQIVLLDGAWGRGQGMELFYPAKMNLIPFATIGRFLRAYHQGTLAPIWVWLNLLGNVLLFAPMGVFLPQLFRIFRNFGIWFVCVLGLVLLVEGLQQWTHTGSLDIDDVLLNILGAVLTYLLWQGVYHIKKWREKQCKTTFVS